MIRKTLGVVFIISAFIVLIGGIYLSQIKLADEPRPPESEVIYKGVMGKYDVYIRDMLNNGVWASTIWLKANDKAASQFLIIGGDFENDGRLDSIVIFFPPKEPLLPPQTKKRWLRTAADQESPTDPEMALAELQLIQAVLAVRNEKHLDFKLETVVTGK